MQFFTQHKTAHVTWAIIVLIALLIISMSNDFAGNPDIANIISIAVGLTSLTLAFLAIGYSFFSSYQTSETSKEIAANIARISGPAESLQKTSRDLEDILLSVDTRSQKVEIHIAEVAKMLSTPSKGGVATQDILTSPQYFESSSTYVKIAWYACIRGSESKAIFDAEKAGMNSTDIASIFGVISTLVSFNLLTAHFDGNGVRVQDSINIGSARENIAFLRRPKIGQEAALRSHFNKIDKYFGVAVSDEDWTVGAGAS